MLHTTLVYHFHRPHHHEVTRRVGTQHRGVLPLYNASPMIVDGRRPRARYGALHSGSTETGWGSRCRFNAATSETPNIGLSDVRHLLVPSAATRSRHNTRHQHGGRRSCPNEIAADKRDGWDITMWGSRSYEPRLVKKPDVNSHQRPRPRSALGRTANEYDLRRQPRRAMVEITVPTRAVSFGVVL